MRKTVLVLFGGTSNEHDISLKSAAAVIAAIDRRRYDVLSVGITREGRWLMCDCAPEYIASGEWEKTGVGAALSPDRTTAGLMLKNGEKVRVDAVFPVLHGKCGEDGTIQGLCFLAGLPVVGCGVLSSAVCMDKDVAHRLAKQAGVQVPHSIVFEREDAERAITLACAMAFPVFVKPARSGSSIGITKAEGPEGVAQAVERAFLHDTKVLIEEAVDGFEIGCAIIGRAKLTAGEVDEVEFTGGFNSYEKKYCDDTTAIHVPARIPDKERDRAKATAKKLYRALDCDGYARIDMFYTTTGEIVFNEVNTIPGMTALSRFPKMMAAVGIDFPHLISLLLKEAGI